MNRRDFLKQFAIVAIGVLAPLTSLLPKENSKWYFRENTKWQFIAGKYDPETRWTVWLDGKPLKFYHDQSGNSHHMRVV